jgi:hypothetical protein
MACLNEIKQVCLLSGPKYCLGFLGDIVRIVELRIEQRHESTTMLLGFAYKLVELYKVP